MESDTGGELPDLESGPEDWQTRIDDNELPHRDPEGGARDAIVITDDELSDMESDTEDSARNAVAEHGSDTEGSESGVDDIFAPCDDYSSDGEAIQVGTYNPIDSLCSAGNAISADVRRILPPDYYAPIDCTRYPLDEIKKEGEPGQKIINVKTAAGKLVTRIPFTKTGTRVWHENLTLLDVRKVKLPPRERGRVQWKTIHQSMKKFDKVLLHWLYYMIDGYASSSVLQENGVIVKPALAEDYLEGAYGHTIMYNGTPRIYIDLETCMTDEEVIVTLAHEMGHALEAVQNGTLLTDHGKRWQYVVQIYADALCVQRIAKRAPNMWINLSTIVRIHKSPSSNTQPSWPRDMTIAPIDTAR
jgi:hypothetical protein